MNKNKPYPAHNRLINNQHSFNYDIESEWPPEADLSEIFIGLTRILQRSHAITKGVPVIYEPDGTRFVAAATWNNGRTRKNLSIKLPHVFSLFKNIAEDGRFYMDNFCRIFEGNSFERNLLLDSDSQSFAVQPLKYEGRVLGLLGYSSDQPMAFTTFENGFLDEVARQLACRISKTTVKK